MDFTIYLFLMDFTAKFMVITHLQKRYFILDENERRHAMPCSFVDSTSRHFCCRFSRRSRDVFALQFLSRCEMKRYEIPCRCLSMHIECDMRRILCFLLFVSRAWQASKAVLIAYMRLNLLANMIQLSIWNSLDAWYKLPAAMPTEQHYVRVIPERQLNRHGA